MSNSPLVKYIKISPNQYGKRNHKLDTITIHCMAGQLTAEGCGAIFYPTSRQASSNYSVDVNGKIGMYVEENCASWCSSSYTNDHRAVTIEVASDSFYPYKVYDHVYDALIELVTDICRRNGIKKLVWSSNRDNRINHRNGCNMTLHRDFSATACPGEYLISKMPEIAKKVNSKLKHHKKVNSKTPLYTKAYKDPVAKSSKSKTIKKGTSVEFIKDLGKGWSKVKYNGKIYYLLNSHLKNKKLSQCKVKKLNEKKKAYLVKNNKLKKVATVLKANKKIKVICKITDGKYKGYSYIGVGRKRYYIKNL